MHYPHVHPDRPIELLHVHACWELGYCFEGRGIFMVGSKVMPFSAGTVSLVGPDEPHLAQSLNGTSSRWAWLYLDPLPLVSMLAGDLEQLDPTPLCGATFENLKQLAGNDPLRVAMVSLVSELQEQADGQTTMVRALVSQILLLFRRRYDLMPDKASDESRQTHRHLHRLAPALTYMATHYQDHLDVPMLAKKCSMSESHFRRCFIQAMDVSPQVYWQRLRVRMAASLLASSDQTILSISQSVGFESLSSFNRLFKQIMGQTPGQWRQGRLGD